LPDGCFVRIDGSPFLISHDALLLWTPEGYASMGPRPGRATVEVLTPEPIVQCIRAGYRPEIHTSALRFVDEARVSSIR